MGNLEKRGILLLKHSDEKKEIEFELDYLTSLSVKKRFKLMHQKSQELLNNLEKNGHRRASQIIKRK